MQILTANHQIETGDPNGKDRGRTEGAEGVCNTIGRTTISTNQSPRSSQRINHHPKGTQGLPMAPAGYRAEDGLIWHSLGGKTLVPGEA